MFIEPVFGKKFFGREDVLSTLNKRVTSLKGGYRQNLALTGPMLAGKSSILRHFLNSIDDPCVIPLYIELGEGDFLVFCRRFMTTLLYRYLKSEGYQVEGDFEDMRKVCSELIPETVGLIDKILKTLKAKKNDDAYEMLLGLTSVFKSETGKNCIVILDEFQNISNFNLKKPYQTFGKFIMVQKNTMYIVSSSQKTLLKEILAKKLSLLFGNFEIIDVNGFDGRTAKSFLSDIIGEGCADKFLRDYLIQLTQGSPFYLEALSKRFASIHGKECRERDANECLLDSFAELLYGSEGVLNQYFTNNVNFFLEKKNRKKYIPLLISLADGNTTVKAIHKDLGKADRELGVTLQKLQEMDIVYKSGVFYLITDKLFEYWLKYVYSLKKRSEIDDLGMKYLEFRQKMDEDYRNYRVSRGMNVKDVLGDLFRSFRNEKILVGMTPRMMPRFDSVETRIISENVFQITGIKDGKRWVCRAKSGDMTDERDIGELWSLKAPEGDMNIARKIFVPLGGIEQNAFLLAKEQNIWIWDAAQLNGILRIFGKFELVL